jgi:hypothetical protein
MAIDRRRIAGRQIDSNREISLVAELLQVRRFFDCDLGITQFCLNGTLCAMLVQPDQSGIAAAPRE